MKRTQSDINLLEGKLYRTYVEADGRIFEFAKDDQQMIPAYKVIIEYSYLQKLSRKVKRLYLLINFNKLVFSRP